MPLKRQLTWRINVIYKASFTESFRLNKILQEMKLKSPAGSLVLIRLPSHTVVRRFRKCLANEGFCI